jgi:HAE1 family hydrophobic/amphiphilic exporter-1
MAIYQRQAAAVVQNDPDVEALMSTIGGTASTNLSGPNFGQLTVRLKPRNQRKRSVEKIIADLRPRLARIPGLNVYLQNPPTISLGGQITKSQYQMSLQSPDKQELYDSATQLQAEVAALPGVEDVTSDLAITSPEVNVNLNRDKAASLQIDANAIESAFYDAYGQHWVSTISAAVTEYKVLLELQPQYQADPRACRCSILNLPDADPLDMAKSHRRRPQSISYYG